MARKLSTATLRSSPGSSAIDAEAGIIRGVKLMELGKLARFAGEEGKPKQVVITDAHISALLAHAGNKAIPIHDTHEWFDAQGTPNADSVEKNARIGALKAFRRDEAGNLIADAHLNKAKPAANDLIWGAENNPEDNCFSVVFSYLKDDPECIPQNFRAGDLVPSGAATTALFSEDQTQPTKSMDINELIAALADPAVKDALKAIIKSVEATADAAEDEAAAALESEAGVVDQDKKDEDEQKPALMRANLRVSRAVRRQLADLKTGETALLEKAKIQAAAEATALLGKGKLTTSTGAATQPDEVEAAISAQLANGAANRATAIFRVARDYPALYNTARAAGKL